MIHLYSGAGNTFALIDDGTKQFEPSDIQNLCEQLSVDGLLHLLPSHCADFKMRIFNRDGSEAEMCGNGLRCSIFHANLPKICFVETLAGVHKGERLADLVSISLSPPREVKINITDNTHFVNTGVPHAVLFVEDIEGIDVQTLGANIRYSTLFAPKGTNVNFVERRRGQELWIRTYERGVEAETLACGTGSAAAAVIAHVLYGMQSPISVKVRSGEQLTLFFNSSLDEISQIGPVKKMQEICQLPIMAV